MLAASRTGFRGVAIARESIWHDLLEQYHARSRNRHRQVVGRSFPPRYEGVDRIGQSTHGAAIGLRDMYPPKEDIVLA
jgi:hypothetical protein